jgi:hypothetical protein
MHKISILSKNIWIRFIPSYHISISLVPTKFIPWIMSSSGMWRCVVLVLSDVSEERIASIFRVEQSASEESVWPGLQPPGHTGSSLADCSTLKMEAIRSSETSHIPEDDIIHSHRCESLKSYKFILVYKLLMKSLVSIKIFNRPLLFRAQYSYLYQTSPVLFLKVWILLCLGRNY